MRNGRSAKEFEEAYPGSMGPPKDRAGGFIFG